MEVEHLKFGLVLAGPCTYGRLETEEGSVSSKTIPRLRNVMYPQGSTADKFTTHDNFVGQLAALIGIIAEHLVSPDVRFVTVDLATRLLIPIIVLQNHNRYNIMEKGQNYSIDIQAIEDEVKNMVHKGEEVVIVGGSHSLHLHEKLAIAVSKAMRGHSLQETKKDGRFHVHTKMYLDGAILKERWMDEMDGLADSFLKHKPLRAYNSKTRGQKNKKVQKKQGDLHRTYGTRVVPVFVLSLASVDPHLMMEDESLLWTSNDVVIVLQHGTEKIPLSYVSETEKIHVFPSQVQRQIVAGLASVVGGLSAPYERVSHIHERPVVNWLLAAGCHPFGPFANVSKLSQLLRDVALRNTIYARVDSALRKIREMSESLEEQLVDLSSLLYDHRLQDAYMNSSDILESSILTQQYVDHVLENEKERMRCCSIEYMQTTKSCQTQSLFYAVILLAGFFAYFVVIFFSSPVK
ncbi:hypothetical protein L1987_61357 [Smallanthus sonchifolius]|uniref:Uncharacterized protein n=1 Tax=Smallanthus sonchifolius TaxID=185202 RepID=A0ACB9DAY6_9ASTR|nr:hypothetical protein L1987_61357 [Smallanthus sonchifolius]